MIGLPVQLPEVEHNPAHDATTSMDLQHWGNKPIYLWVDGDITECDI